MPMIMVALKLAPNVERLLTEVQDTLFLRHQLVSTRLLPPIIPLALLPEQIVPPLFSTLENLRKRHPLELRGSRPPASEHSVPEKLPGSIPLVIDGYAQLHGEILSPPGGPFPVPLPERPPQLVLAWETASMLALDRITAIREYLTALPPLPVTRAFWLSAMEIYPGPETAQWWAAAEWREIFQRRTTVITE